MKGMSATITPLRKRRHWDASVLTIEAARQDQIAEGDIVRAYDMPGQRDDTYLEGVVERVEEGDRVHVHVTREVRRGEEQQVERFNVAAWLGVSISNGAPCVFLVAKRQRPNAQRVLLFK